MTLRRRIARWLDPSAVVTAQRLSHLQLEIDNARWWLGSEFHDAAALADYLLERDHWWATGKRFLDRQPWSPPAHVTDISGFREWLRGRAKKRA